MQSVHSGHLVLMQAELFGFEAQAGNAVGHVHPLDRCGRRTGAVGWHWAARIVGGNRRRRREEQIKQNQS